MRLLWGGKDFAVVNQISEKNVDGAPAATERSWEPIQPL